MRNRLPPAMIVIGWPTIGLWLIPTIDDLARNGRRWESIPRASTLAYLWPDRRGSRFGTLWLLEMDFGSSMRAYLEMDGRWEWIPQALAPHLN